jgi:long-chain acyl-CoA synthetase
MKESPFIENIMVIGESQKHASAIIVPNFAHVKSWCEIHKVICTTPEDMIKNPQVRDRIMKDVEKVNAQLGHHERIKRPELITKEWTVVSGELTPTLKLKRKIIEQNNKELIGKIYSADDEK